MSEDWTQQEKVVVDIDQDIADLIPKYLNSRRADVEKIRAALGEGDFDRIRVIGHDLRGTGGSYGFQVLTDLGAILEDGGKASDRGAIEGALAKLTLYLEKVVVNYVEF